MSQVLYRKYRSKDFDEIIGQDIITNVIKRAVLDNKVAHAYLFNGPRGTGKTSMARILAKSLNCLNLKEGNPCNECENCLAINSASYMDLIEIDAASNRGIDEIRELKEKMNFMPVKGAFKVYIIDEVHMLTTEAFNALLKSLEEPPQNVVFILATTEIHKIPQTILSRTQRFDFKLATEKEIQKKLKYILDKENVIIDPEALNLIIVAGEGSFRDSETILEKVLSTAGVKSDQNISKEEVESILGFASLDKIDSFFRALQDKNAKIAFSILKEAENSGVDLKQFIKQILLKARGGLIKNIQEGSTDFDSRFLFSLIKEMNQASEGMRFSMIKTLPIDLAILNIVGVQQGEQFSDSINSSSGLKQFTGFGETGKVSKKSSVSTSGKNKIKDKSLVLDEKLESSSQDGSVDDLKKENNSDSTQMGTAKDKASIDKEMKIPNDLKKGWNKVIALAKEENPHLAALLINAVLKSEDSELVMEVPFKFHQQRLEKSSTKKSLEKIFEKAFGQIIPLSFRVNESLMKKDNAPKKLEESNASMVEEVFGDL